MFHEGVVPVKYSFWLAIIFAFCPTLVSQRVLQHRETVAASDTASFEQKLDRRVRFDTAGRTMVASIVELAFAYQLPTAIEYADREASTRPLDLQFQNESVRRSLASITEQVPGYSVSFSGGIVDVFATKGREDPSNVLNTSSRTLKSRNWIRAALIWSCFALSHAKLRQLACAAEA